MAPLLHIIVCIGSIKSLLVSAISLPEQLSRAVPSHAVASPQTVHSKVTTYWGQMQSVTERNELSRTKEDTMPARPAQ